MNRKWFLLLFFVGMVFIGGEVYAQELIDAVESIERQRDRVVLQSMAVSEALTRITGTAIYPVFGLAFLGAWDHINGIDVWYATPFLYVPLMGMMLIEFLKNTFGLAFGPLKKGADLALQLLDLINANLGLFMSVGIAMNTFQKPVDEGASALLNIVLPTAYAALTTHDSVAVGGLLLMAVSGILGAIIYFVIWVTMQSFALLILLSPFNALDSILRSVQLSAVTLMGVAFLVFPPLAVCIACSYIFIALYLFRFCWSHLLFSTKVVYAYLFARGTGTVDLERGIPCFSGQGIQGCYPRTSGRLIRKGEKCMFVVPVLVGPDKEYVLNTELVSVHEGIIFGTLVMNRTEDDVVLLMLTPHMNGHEEVLAKELGCPIIPFAFTNGIRNGIRHFKAQF